MLLVPMDSQQQYVKFQQQYVKFTNNFFLCLDIQILPIKMSQTLQEKEESKKDCLDQSLS